MFVSLWAINNEKMKYLKIFNKNLIRGLMDDINSYVKFFKEKILND